MMINKRLIGLVPDSKKYVVGNILAQWISLATNIAMMTELFLMMPMKMGFCG